MKIKLVSIRPLLLIGAVLFTVRPAVSQVKVWEGSMTLPTYEEGAPDPNPPFDIYATSRFNYPYTLRTNLTGTKADHTWRAVYLENEYLKCSVLPDIGGHIYTCIDKISGQPIFYANPSIKKAQIGYRGAWAAFGVEFNFPVSHNWVSMSPVDFAYGAHPDGSASIWISNIDRVYGMQWQVELILRPGSTVLEQRTTLYNRSDVRHRYYWWSNAGVQVWDDSRVDYPMRFAASHGYTHVYNWPVDSDGRDLRIIGNHTGGPVSLFVHGSHEPFMGIWNPHTQTGTVHYSEYRDVPAKKIWSWGVDPAGLAWRTALSDNHSAYVEVQAGLFRNQETFAFLEPSQAIRFSEYWMPVRGIGGISRANKVGIVRVEDHGKSVSAALNVNERIPNAHLVIRQGSAKLWGGTADLRPETTWSHIVERQPNADKVTFELRDSSDRPLLAYTEGVYDWDPASDIHVGPQRAFPVPSPEKRSEDEWLRLGRDQELNGKAVVAVATYGAALERFPQSQSLAIAAGRLAVSLQHYQQAELLLRTAQMRDTPNSQIAYYLGIAEEGLGHQREAETAYEIAYRQAELRGPAALRLGEMSARSHALDPAIVYLRAAVTADPGSLRTREELEALLRADNQVTDADRLAQAISELEPDSDFVKVDTRHADFAHLAADPYRLLRVASQYIRLGLYDKALEILDRHYSAVPADQSEPGTALPQDNPLVLYYAAYCKRQLGQDEPQRWTAASKLSTRLIFPASETDRVVLETALEVHPDDATAHFLLGTLLFSKALSEPGIAHWREAKRLNPSLPVLDADLGDALLKLRHSPEEAIAAFRDGMAVDAENAALYAGLDAAMSLTGAPAAARAEALSHYPNADSPHSTMPADLVYQLALTRAEASNFDGALRLFKDRFFPSEEGGITSDQVLFEVKLMQAEAAARAGKCGEAAGIFAESAVAEKQDLLSARDYFRLAGVAGTCKDRTRSEQLLHKAEQSQEASDLVWILRAEQSLGHSNAADSKARLSAALEAIESHSEEGSDSSTRCYEQGLLQQALGEKEEAKRSFDQALLLPDARMAHHLARLALESQN